MEDKQKNDRYSLMEYYFDIVCKNLPVVRQIIDRYGDLSLADYLQTLVFGAKPSYQKRDDLFEVVYQYAAPLLGEAVAKRVVTDLSSYPVVLTTNHHGVDYCFHTMQGSLIFSLNAMAEVTSATTVPIFSFGNVPLNNSTYPRGILLYHFSRSNLDSMPQKLPVFPDRFKRQMVSATPAFDQTMIDRAVKRLDKMVHDKHITSTLAVSLRELLRQDYSAPSVIKLSNYSQQAVVLNNRLWKQLFAHVKKVPELAYLEIEKIVSALLTFDLSNPKSLAWYVMFDPELREHVLKELDGSRACWERGKLAERLSMNFLDKDPQKSLVKCGTVFFWGIDSSGKRIPLSLETKSPNDDRLRGVDDHGNLWEIPWTPMAILDGLHRNSLLPSIFTCFLVLSFARHIPCVGGYFQGEYLPAMQQGIVTALQNTSGYHDIAHFVAQVPTGGYLDSMLAIMTRAEDDSLIPAGPVEIIAGGGISDKDIEHMLSLTVREAHLAALFETIPDVMPSKLLSLEWKKQVAADCYRLLKEKIVLK